MLVYKGESSHAVPPWFPANAGFIDIYGYLPEKLVQRCPSLLSNELLVRS